MNATKKKILIIEDDGFLINLLERKFSSDFDVYFATDGATGLEMAKKDPPDLIMLDLMVPRMDGETVLEELKADPKTKDIHVIVMTNLMSDDAREKVEKLGVKDFYIKSEVKVDDLAGIAKNKLSE